MEHVGGFFDEEWESLSKLFSTTETADFMLQLQGDHGLLSMNGNDNGGLSYGTDNPPVAFGHDETDNNFLYFSQESSITSCGSDHGMFFTNNPSIHEHLQHSNNVDDVNNQLTHVAIDDNINPDAYQSIDFFDMDSKNLESLCINQDFQTEMVCDQLENAGISPVSDKEMQLKRKFEKVAPENFKKKSRGSQNVSLITTLTRAIDCITSPLYMLLLMGVYHLLNAGTEK